MDSVYSVGAIVSIAKTTRVCDLTLKNPFLLQ